MKRAVVLAFVAGVVVTSLSFGVRAAAMRKHINLPGRADALPFSDAVLVGDTLYVATAIRLYLIAERR